MYNKLETAEINDVIIHCINDLRELLNTYFTLVLV